MHLVKKIQFFLQRFIPLQVLGGLLDTAFQHFHIRKDQLCIDGFDIRDRIDLAIDMHDIRVFETAYNMYDGCHLTDMAQKLVAQAFALGCALYKSCDVIKLNRRVNSLLGIVHFWERANPPEPWNWKRMKRNS
jgi:hypothetical protein